MPVPEPRPGVARGVATGAPTLYVYKHIPERGVTLKLRVRQKGASATGTVLLAGMPAVTTF